MQGGDHLSVRPEPGIISVAGNNIIPYLVLLQKGLAMRQKLLSYPVVSYTAISPLPLNKQRRFAFCCAVLPGNLLSGILLSEGLPALWSPDFPHILFRRTDARPPLSAFSILYIFTVKKPMKMVKKVFCSLLNVKCGLQLISAMLYYGE